MPDRDHCPHCGAVLDQPQGVPRSVPQLRRYFALIKATFHHWPEAHPRQFANEEECRKWLQMRAGHKEVALTVPLIGMSKDKAVALAEAAIRSVGGYADVSMQGDTLVIHKPKSIAFGKLRHKAACVLFDDVAAVIRAETGLDPDQLLKETEAAA